MKKIDKNLISLSEHGTFVKGVMNSLVDVYFTFNVSTESIVTGPFQMVDKKEYALFEQLDLLSSDRLFDTVKHIASTLSIKKVDEFVSMFDYDTLMNLVNNNVNQVKKVFKMKNIMKQTINAEVHIDLLKLSNSNQVWGVCYIVEKLDNKQFVSSNVTSISELDIDALTGCYNRNKLIKYANEVLEDKESEGAFILIDIDGFKMANDLCGHLFGDELLVELSLLIRSVFRPTDVIVRLGGDEFAAFINGLTDPSVIIQKAKLLNKICNKEIIAKNGLSIKTSVSIGISLFPRNGETFEQIYHNADKALYLSKSKGKNTYSFYEETESKQLNEIFNNINYTQDYKILLDSFINLGVVVIEESSKRILFYNRKIREASPLIEIGDDCQTILKLSCDNCPINNMGELATVHKTIYSELFGDFVELMARRIVWREHINAIMISIWPRSIESYSNPDFNIIKSILPPDNVTGGNTRSGFIRAVELLKNNGEDLSKYCVVFINILNFKVVNELYGSSAGDNLLRIVYSIISNSFLKPMIGARKDSDHFVFLVDRNNLDLQSLPVLLNLNWKYDSNEMNIHMNCGICYIDSNDIPVYKLIDRAKLASTYVNNDYIKPYSIFEQSQLLEYSEKVSLFSSFDKGVRNKDFTVYYQPIIDVSTKQIVGAEALARGVTELGTIMPPSQFIPFLEKSGYIVKLDEFVIKEVSLFLHNRFDKNLPFVPISVNLSQTDLLAVSQMNVLLEEFENSILPKKSINFELTETTYTIQEKERKELLQRIRETGTDIILDDFGTGYSSFGMFENYLFDKVKIDMSFVKQLTYNENVRIVVENIIRMCHQLGVSVVAEGVETKEEFDILDSMNCDFVQGYYFAKPMDKETFIKYLNDNLK